MSWRKGDAARPGAVFKGTNRNGIRAWTTTCTVTDAAPGGVFGWDVSYSRDRRRRHWRYDIAAQRPSGSKERPKRARACLRFCRRHTAIGEVFDIPVRPSCQSASLYARYMPRTPSQRNGSGSQFGDW